MSRKDILYHTVRRHSPYPIEGGGPNEQKDKIAFGLYFVGALALFAFGIAYLTCSTFMPYHQEAVNDHRPCRWLMIRVNMNWEELSSGVQILFQALIKIAAAGFFGTGVAALILLFIPFRKGDAWDHWAIPLLELIWNGISLFVTATVAIKTQASTPWPATIAGIIIITVAFLLSPGLEKAKVSEKSNLKVTSTV